MKLAVVAAVSLALASADLPPGTLPPWPPSYAMADSTISQPCNNAGANGGYLNASFFASFGIVSVDWSNGKAVWSKASPQNCEEMLTNQVQQLHAINPSMKVWTYKNLVKALPWMTAVRLKLEDPAWWGFFLHYKNGKPTNASTMLYHDFEQTTAGNCGAGVQCGEYLWDHRNGTMLTDFLVNTYAANGPGVTGFFIDDSWSSKGPSEENSSAIADIGLSPADVSALTAGWSSNMNAVQSALLKTNGFTWQSLWNVPGWSTTAPQAGCAAFLRDNCGPTGRPQSEPMFMNQSPAHPPGPVPIAYPEQSLAAFLLVRGPYAWLGTGWLGCLRLPPVAGLGQDFGSPNGFCAETAPSSGVFTRDWSKATVQLDCNSFTATIKMK